MGARPLAKTINDLIKVPISKKILFDNLSNGSIITVDFRDGAIEFETSSFLPTDLPVVDLNGFIRLD